MTNESVAFLQLISAVIVMSANVVLTVLTYRYVKLTGGMLDHMRSAQAASVDIDITFRDHDAYLNVANRGSTAATQITFELSGFEWAKHSSIPELRDHGISYLPAGRTMRFWLGFPNWDMVKKDHPSVRVALAYDAQGSRQRRDFVIDMTQYLGTSIQAAPEERIVNAIDRLKDALSGRSPFARMGLFRPAKKACSMCAESIPAAAKICSHCHSPQVESVHEPEGETTGIASEPAAQQELLTQRENTQADVAQDVTSASNPEQVALSPVQESNSEQPVALERRGA